MRKEIASTLLATSVFISAGCVPGSEQRPALTEAPAEAPPQPSDSDQETTEELIIPDSIPPEIQITDGVREALKEYGVKNHELNTELLAAVRAFDMIHTGLQENRQKFTEGRPLAVAVDRCVAWPNEAGSTIVINPLISAQNLDNANSVEGEIFHLTMFTTLTPSHGLQIMDGPSMYMISREGVGVPGTLFENVNYMQWYSFDQKLGRYVPGELPADTSDISGYSIVDKGGWSFIEANDGTPIAQTFTTSIQPDELTPKIMNQICADPESFDIAEFYDDDQPA